MTTQKPLFEHTTCPRCGGSGNYSFNLMHGSRCYGCYGSGYKLTKRDKAQSNSYRQGFVLSVCRSLQALTEQKNEEQQAASNGRELVLIKMQAVTAQFGEARYGTKKHAISDTGAFAAGKVDGRKVAVDRRAVGNNPQTTRRIAA